jgi:mannose-6-phosphate isomerase-like protein (cupin superfamily)
MAKLTFEKNIITVTKEYTASEMAKIEEFKQKYPFTSTVGMTRLLWMDDSMVKDAEFYMECLWLWPGQTPSGTTEEPHAHPFPEVIGFISTDPDNPQDLDGRMEIHLGDEVHNLTKSCLVFIPPGLRHGPLTFREVNRPTFFFTLAPVSKYGRKSELMAKEATAHVEIPSFKAPRKDQNGSRYARYIITQPISHIPKNLKNKPAPKAPRDIKSSHLVSLDSTIHKGAFYVDFVWIWSGTLTMAAETHAHDWDEMIGLVGIPSKENPREIDKGVALKMGEDIYNMKKSSVVYVPKNVPHAPIYFKDIKKPVLCFTIGTAPKWNKTKKEK